MASRNPELTAAIAAHKKRLRNLTDTQARNLMEHAANETPLMACEDMDERFVDSKGRC